MPTLYLLIIMSSFIVPGFWTILILMLLFSWMALVDLVRDVAARKGATPAQVALAWLLAQKPWIVPIPGTTKLHRLEENLGAQNVEFTPQELGEIDAAASQIPVEGERLPETVLKMTGH